MIRMNRHYNELKESYLFFNIARKVKDYQALHPEKRLLRMGVGDVSLPLCGSVIRALHEAADMQGKKETFIQQMEKEVMPAEKEAAENREPVIQKPEIRKEEKEPVSPKVDWNSSVIDEETEKAVLGYIAGCKVGDL